ncbi:MAG: two-component sensor histidine kinase, partial [Frankiales bacterium]|nr:two-component sensor histidine kinase [Frankiales bacterium]
MSRRGPLAPVRSIKTKLGLVVVGATGAGLLGAVYGLQSGFRVRWTLLLSLVVALAVVQLLARGMTAPLREMAAAASAMARGEHDVRVAVTSRDEVGRLAQAFNGMAADLAEVDAQRRRLVADVSHELRTPLTALQAQLENMLDGVSGPETLAAALAQTARLTRLVAQLLDLSRLEAGQVPLHREPVEVARLAEDALAAAAALG